MVPAIESSSRFMTRSAPDSFGRIRLWLAWVALLAGANLMAQAPPMPATVSTNHSTNMALKQVSPGVFEIGKVRFDQKQRLVHLPVVLNLNEGIVEYLLVNSGGKTYESLLRTDAEPYHVHLAMLLLGALGAGTNSFPADLTKPPPGDKVILQLSWKKGSREQRQPVEALIHNRRTHTAMSSGEWIYNGSQIFEGTFIAQRDGSIISLIIDPDALINNAQPGREDHQNWLVNKSGLPPLNSPMQLTIKLVN